MGPAERLRALLSARGLAWPAPIHHFDRIGSTNDGLKMLAAAGAPEWSVVIADSQTAGRGRRGRPWHSLQGGLYLSVLLRPEGGARLIALVPLAAGLAVYEALRELGVSTSLKWPNDLLVGNRKIGGLLAEATSGAKGVETVVVGIGINIGAGLAPEMSDVATSLDAETGGAQDVIDAAAAVLARLTVWYDALARGDDAGVLAAWRAAALPWWGERVEVLSGGRRMRGRARGLDSHGALILSLDDGSEVAVLSGDARWLRLEGLSKR